MRIEDRPLDTVTPYAGNPRRIPAAAGRAVATSIERYGFRQPIVVDAEGVVIIVGHTRLQAAKQLGLSGIRASDPETFSPPPNRPTSSRRSISRCPPASPCRGHQGLALSPPPVDWIPL